MNDQARDDSPQPAELAARQPRSSRQRYLNFVQDYKHHRLDDRENEGEEKKPAEDSGEAGEDAAEQTPAKRKGKRREYLREYVRWLWPYRFAVAVLFVLALFTAALEMVEPLFMRFIIDRVLLNTSFDSSQRLVYLHVAGALFVGVVILSHAI